MNEMEHYFEEDFPEDEMDQPEDFNPEFLQLQEDAVLAEQLQDEVCDTCYEEEKELDLAVTIMDESHEHADSQT